MGQTLTYGVYLPDEGERNCYSGLANNWQILDDAVGAIAGKANASHTHGNITNDGAIGSTSGLPVITGTDGVLTTGTFGNTAGTFCEGNDSRLSDARTPVAHTHSKSDITDLFNSANTWSALNSYSNGQIRIKSLSQEIGVIPSNSVIQYLEFADKNDARHGIVGLWDYDNGASEIQMYITDKFKNGQKDPTGTAESTFLSFGFKTDGSKFFTFAGQIQNSLIPNANNTYDLGSSSYKWKTLNGVNPGALSLPSSSGIVIVDTSSFVWDGTTENSYTAPFTGWIGIGSSIATYVKLFNNNTKVGMTQSHTSGTDMRAYIPMTAGDEIKILGIKSSSFVLRAYPCQGNV